MIERDHPALPIGPQCRLLPISRSLFYLEPAGETEMNLGLMQLIDRQMTRHLQNAGNPVKQKRIRRLTRLMRLRPIYQKPNSSKPGKGHKPIPISWAGRA